MNHQFLQTSALIATGFVGWSIIAKFANVKGGWVGVIAMAATTITTALLSSTELRSELPTLKGFLIVAFGGIANGIAIYYYSQKVTDPQIPTAVFVVIVSVFMVMIAPLLSWLIYGHAPSLNQGMGYMLAIGAIYFLGK